MALPAIDRRLNRAWPWTTGPQGPGKVSRPGVTVPRGVCAVDRDVTDNGCDSGPADRHGDHAGVRYLTAVASLSR